MTDAHVTVYPGASIGHVTPEIHGHFSEHLGRCIYDAVETTVDAPARELGDDEDDLPLVHASATTDGDETFVTVTNLDCRESRSVEVSVEGAPADEADAQVLFADADPGLHVDTDNADELGAQDVDVSVTDGALALDLEPSSVAAVSVR